MRESDVVLPAAERDRGVPVPHESVPAFLESLEEAGRERGDVPIVVGVSSGDSGLHIYLESTTALTLRDFAMVVAWHSAARR